MNQPSCPDSFRILDSFELRGKPFNFFSLKKLAAAHPAVADFPRSIKVLLEAVLRWENGREVTRAEAEGFLRYDPRRPGQIEIPFKPARVLLQDLTGVPCVVDLAAMREAMARLGGDPARINPLVPVNLVIDHSVHMDRAGSPDARAENERIEYRRNRERYEFLRWGQKAFDNFTVVPPGSGICHQVNLEYLSSVVRSQGGLVWADSCVGTDSHTPMVNGLGVLGWGVGGIEAEANMLGQPIYMLAPRVVGVRITGRTAAGVTATDVVLTLTEMLRKKGVVGAFVEFFGPGLASLSVPDRATLSNMAPEYGATIGYFPIDRASLDYLRLTGRPDELVELVEAWSRAQGLFVEADSPEPLFEQTLEFDLAAVEACLAGPKRPQDRIALAGLKKAWLASLCASIEKRGFGLSVEKTSAQAELELPGGGVKIGHGAVLIASITSCTNTSNPAVLIAAGLLARNAVKAGLAPKAWVKTSFAPGSLTVTDYLAELGLLSDLEKLGFHVAGYGCATCIGNSGPLAPAVAAAVSRAGLVGAAVLSGNRNFEGRVHPLTRANFLASPPLVVAFALAGSVDFDFEADALGLNRAGKPVWLRELWPSDQEVSALVGKALSARAFRKRYDGIEQSNERWNAIERGGAERFAWNPASTYIQEPPFFAGLSMQVGTIQAVTGARVLVMVGDSITTDHISPAGDIDADSPAGRYLQSLGVAPDDFNSYGSRRGNDRVMLRGTFANVRLRNQLVPGAEGSRTLCFLNGKDMDIPAAAEQYKAAGVPTIVLAGKDYGMGSSRDWAAKGLVLLGARAVIAESYERIHRSNLVGMGLLPLEYLPGENAASLGLSGRETFSIQVNNSLSPRQRVQVTVRDEAGRQRVFETVCRVDTPVEVDYLRNGGILQTVLRQLARA